MIKYVVLVVFLAALSMITGILLSGKEMHTCHGKNNCDKCAEECKSKKK